MISINGNIRGADITWGDLLTLRRHMPSLLCSSFTSIDVVTCVTRGLKLKHVTEMVRVKATALRSHRLILYLSKSRTTRDWTVCSQRHFSCACPFPSVFFFLSTFNLVILNESTANISLQSDGLFPHFDD